MSFRKKKITEKKKKKMGEKTGKIENKKIK